MTQERDGILDVPDIAMFAVTDVPELVAEYKKRFGFSPEGICLPLTTSGGLSYNSTLGIRNVSPARDGHVRDLEWACRAAAGEGLQIYLCIDPTLPFATTSSDFSLVDNTGDESPKCCVVNRLTREAVRTILNETASVAQKHAFPVAGYVFSTQNLWPMGAEGERLELTCFCRHCWKAMSEAAPDLDLSAFEKSPNPWNLALRDSGSGISHLHEIAPGDQPVAILEKSKAREYYNPAWYHSEDAALGAARQLFLYLHARDRVTSHAVGEMLRAVPAGTKRVLISEPFQYDFTDGMFLATKVSLGVDELWMPPLPAKLREGAVSDVSRPLPRVRTYLAARARYHVDALFNFIAFVNSVARLDPEMRSKDRQDLRTRFVERSQRMLQSLHLSKMEVLAVRAENRSFVAPLVTEDAIQRLMSALGLNIRSELDRLTELLSPLRRPPEL